MTIQEFCKDPRKVDGYRAWVIREDTKTILDMIAEDMRPLGLPATGKTAEAALYYSGVVDTYFAFLRKLLQLTDVIRNSEERRYINEFMATADYGAAKAKEA